MLQQELTSEIVNAFYVVSINSGMDFWKKFMKMLWHTNYGNAV